jgi:rhamnopyranosyl-N-acetylglucosaminyl-diphospho-decaprenol beta-1,3/1,4-galactofuranosyltransferase
VLDKIIVVDNNSSDQTAELFNTLFANENSIEYLNTGENLGGAGGFKIGMALAQRYQYDAIWLMDDDLLPTKDCLKNIISEDIIGIVQPIRFNQDGSCAELSPVKYDLRNPLITSPKRHSVKDIYDSTKDDKVILVDGVSFEGPLISKEVIDCIGLPDERFFIFYDDLDYSLRAKKHNFIVCCSPKARAYRLLVNNQKSDLSSWKGYFMLRNVFYNHHAYGENIFVKLKPYILYLGLVTINVVKGKFGLVRKCHSAMCDYKFLKNNEKHKPH